MASKARFVSKYGNYSVGIQSAEAERLGHNGSMIPSRRRIDANFHNKHVGEEDFAVALRTFTFTGLPEDTDTNEHVSPRWRVSVWDSLTAKEIESWSDDEIELMVSKLRSDPSYGLDFIEVFPPKAPVPFPGYDEMSEDEILAALALLKIDAETVLAYEVENQNREKLVRKISSVEDDDAVVVSA